MRTRHTPMDESDLPRPSPWRRRLGVLGAASAGGLLVAFVTRLFNDRNDD